MEGLLGDVRLLSVARVVADVEAGLADVPKRGWREPDERVGDLQVGDYSRSFAAEGEVPVYFSSTRDVEGVVTL